MSQVIKGSTKERLVGRLEHDAQQILERDLHRRRWTASDRDAITARLLAIVKRETAPAGRRGDA